MLWNSGYFFGMNFFWWVFWVLALVVFFSLLTPVSRTRMRAEREQPLDILRRRYAAGELSTEEYNERRNRLMADMGQASRVVLAQPQ